MPRRWWWFAARSSMARKYIRKGGHGGARSGSGLPVGFWQERGGKKAAAAAKKQREAEAKAKAEAARCAQKQRWQQWGAARVSASEQDSGQQVAAQKASEQQPIQTAEHDQQ